ncbi:hypothetical protein GCM10009664_39630 [Kitasatospora gansuensis]
MGGGGQAVRARPDHGDRDRACGTHGDPADPVRQTANRRSVNIRLVNIRRPPRTEHPSTKGAPVRPTRTPPIRVTVGARCVLVPGCGGPIGFRGRRIVPPTNCRRV